MQWLEGTAIAKVQFGDCDQNSSTNLGFSIQLQSGAVHMVAIVHSSGELEDGYTSQALIRRSKS